MNETFSYNLKKVEGEKEEELQKQSVFHAACQGLCSKRRWAGKSEDCYQWTRLTVLISIP